MSGVTMRQESNGLGLAGFIVSLVGLCSGGVLSPIGLILSLIALKNTPRGFAIAGVVIGAIGSCGILLAIILVPVALGMVLAAAGLAGLAAALASAAGPELETQLETAFVSINAEEYHGTKGVYPATLGEATSKLDPNSPLLKDHWGNAYEYEVAPDGSKFWLFSSGPDGLAGTSDDVESEVTSKKFGPRPSAQTVAPTRPSIPASGEDPERSEPAEDAPPGEKGEERPKAPEPG